MGTGIEGGGVPSGRVPAGGRVVDVVEYAGGGDQQGVRLEGRFYGLFF